LVLTIIMVKSQLGIFHLEQLVSYKQEKIEKVKFGGYVYSKRGDYASPSMGSGYFSRPPIYDQTYFMIQVTVLEPEF